MDTTRQPNLSIHPHAPGGQMRSDEDDHQARQGRERHEGFQTQGPGMPLQPPPMFFTYDHHPLPILDHYKGRSAFLVAGGPSLAHGQDYEFLLRIKGLAHANSEEEEREIRDQAEQLAALPRIYDLAQFYQPGIWSMTMNNAIRVVKSTAWSFVDKPSNFILSPWLDPCLMKFAPICHTQKTLWDSTAWKDTGMMTMDCPNVIYYKRNEHFQAPQFLTEDTINWGNHKKYGGGRSIMFAAIRILYLLGFRRIYLVGVDLNMADDKLQHYAFAQDRARGSINGNSGTYQLMHTRFEQLLPYFKKAGLEVFNCNPDSKLNIFPTVPFDTAVGDVLAGGMRGIDLHNERTNGLYDREVHVKEEKTKKANKEAEKEARINSGRYTDAQRQEVKSRLDTLRTDLGHAKDRLTDHLNSGREKDSQWQSEKDALEHGVTDTRLAFRTCEDEKRVKWGEPPRWGLWSN